MSLPAPPRETRAQPRVARPESRDSRRPPAEDCTQQGNAVPLRTGPRSRADAVLFLVEKKRRPRKKGTRGHLPDAYAVWRLLELFGVLRLRLFYFILIFNVGLREAGKVEEEELLGTLEDSMSCHLNLPWGEHSVFHSASYTDTHRPSQR